MLGLLLLLAPLADPAQTEDGFRALAEQVELRTLDNGLRVVVLPRGKAPVASFHLYVRAGAIDEESGLTGLAHFAEHMAFKGSRRIGALNWALELEAMRRCDSAWAAYELAATDENGLFREDEVAARYQRFLALDERAVGLADAGRFDAAVESAGGRDQNATTGADATQYFVSLPSNRMEQWFWLTREQIGGPVMREFYRERSVVMEERRMRTDSSPVGAAVEALLNTAFVAHPYRDSAIGHMSDLEFLDRPEMIRFWKRHYTAERMVLAVVGRVDPDLVFEFAERYLGDLAGSAGGRPRRTTEPAQQGERIVKLSRPSSPMVLAGWHTPSLTGRSNQIYGALADLLFNGPSSRAYVGLVKTDGIAAQIQGFAGFPGRIDPSLFVALTVPLPGKSPRKCLERLQAEITRLAVDGPNDRELEGLKRRTKMKVVASLSSNSGLARALAEAEAEDGGWNALFNQLVVVDGITPAEIQAAAAGLSENQRTSIYLLPPGMNFSGEMEKIETGGVAEETE